MDRLERLLNLLAALINTDRPLRREDIHARVPGYPERDDSFRRQFERDKETLRQMGVPIAIEPVIPHSPEQGTGYRVHQRDYALADPGLTPEELTALHLATSSVRFLGEDAQGAIRKLGGAPAAEMEESLAVEVAGAEHLEPCFAAITEHRALTFKYKGQARTVVPARLSFRAGRWYLSTWDVDRGAERLFRLDRMEGPPELGDVVAEPVPVPARSGAPLPGWEQGDEEPIAAELRIDAEQSDFAIQALGGSGAVRRNDDGGITVEMGVRNQDGFRNFVLGMLDHAEVVGPPELRADVVSWLERIAGESGVDE